MSTLREADGLSHDTTDVVVVVVAAAAASDITIEEVDLNDESIALFGQKSSNQIQKILEDGKHLDGEVKEHFPEQECALIVYSNYEKELLMYGTHLSTVQIVSDSRLLVKVGTRVHRDGMLGEVVLNEQPHNLHLLKFVKHNKDIYDVVTYDEIKNLPIADHTLFEDDEDNKQERHDERVSDNASSRCNGIRGERWNEMYDRLVKYEKEYKTTCVPRKYSADLQLGRWVNKQRSYYNTKNHASPQLG